jgi:hypothetical protein
MMVVPICHVDLLHANVDVNSLPPDHNRVVLYQTPVMETEDARLVHKSAMAALPMTLCGLGSAARFRFSPQLAWLVGVVCGTTPRLSADTYPLVYVPTSLAGV